MKLLVTGAGGQVGWELARSLQPLGEVIALDRHGADLSDPQALRETVRSIEPQVIVNAAAYTAVDKAEQDEAQAEVINARSPGVLAEEAKRLGALLIHYSTDYVFDGEKQGRYLESDPVNPLNAYGRTKLAGERAIAAAGGPWLVLRTSWVYSSRGGNFPRTILRLAAERERLTIVEDQFGAPTSARLIADLTAHLVRQARGELAAARFESEVLHLTAGGEASWLDLARAVVDGARARGMPVKAAEVTGIPASAYKVAARRPMNSRLSLDRLAERYRIRPPDWRQGVALMLDELAAAPGAK